MRNAVYRARDAWASSARGGPDAGPTSGPGVSRGQASHGRLSLRAVGPTWGSAWGPTDRRFCRGASQASEADLKGLIPRRNLCTNIYWPVAPARPRVGPSWDPDVATRRQLLEGPRGPRVGPRRARRDPRPRRPGYSSRCRSARGRYAALRRRLNLRSDRSADRLGHGAPPRAGGRSSPSVLAFGGPGPYPALATLDLPSGGSADQAGHRAPPACLRFGQPSGSLARQVGTMPYPCGQAGPVGHGAPPSLTSASTCGRGLGRAWVTVPTPRWRRFGPQLGDRVGHGAPPRPGGTSTFRSAPRSSRRRCALPRAAGGPLPSTRQHGVPWGMVPHSALRGALRPSI